MCEKCNRLEEAIYQTARKYERAYLSEDDPLETRIAVAIYKVLDDILDNMNGRQ